MPRCQRPSEGVDEHLARSSNGDVPRVAGIAGKLVLHEATVKPQDRQHWRVLPPHPSPDVMETAADVRKQNCRSINKLGGSNTQNLHYSMKTRFALFAAILLGGCATPIPFSTVSIGGAPTVQSTKSASVCSRSGVVQAAQGSYLLPAGGAFIPVPTGPMTQWQFGEADQQELAEQLRAELRRLRVFSSVTCRTPAAQDVSVTLAFLRTTHRKKHQEYELDVELVIHSAEKAQTKRYLINSSDGASLLEKMNTNGPEGKVKAVRKLLEAVIPDLQAFARDA
jgi:hypothetical protein